ncbi:MAG: IS66 family transposase, partial [Synergistaceae bacterium]|nr:IS66 family transposase [Synergistaceae bacterium]
DRLPEGLPVETIEYVIPEKEQACPMCGKELHVLGKEVRNELKLIPAKAVIIEHIRYTYGCRNCERNGISAPVIKAQTNEPVIKGSFASPEAIAQIMTQKFVMGAPLYRQEKDFERNGIRLSRQTMSNWLIKSTEDWLEPVYNTLKKQLVEENDNLFADETTLKVLREPGKKATSDSYLWLYRTGRDSPSQTVICEYHPDRKAIRPAEFLKDYTGYLHTDGYQAYHSLNKNIIVVGCLAHARRKWCDALNALSPADREGSNALCGKQYCDKLFAIERSLAECTPEERYQKRLELARPILDEFYAWLLTLSAGNKSSFGRAVAYTIREWKYLERYLLDGRLEISNNRSERTVKSFVIDRKNFLFCNTPKGAKCSAIMFSIIETAKENGLNPYKYLAYIFKNAPNWDILNNSDMLRKLLPDQAPDFCKAGAPDV